MIKTISPKTTQGDMLAMLEESGARLKAKARTSRTATSKTGNVVHVDFRQASSLEFLRLYCAATKEPKGIRPLSVS